MVESDFCIDIDNEKDLKKAESVFILLKIILTAIMNPLKTS